MCGFFALVLGFLGAMFVIRFQYEMPMAFRFRSALESSAMLLSR